ncbi:MAG: T9SS type A sorting domain-containing protein [Saprospiraceae bacterium]
MKYLIIIFSLLSVHMATAQSFEIRTINKGNGEIGVEMRETSGTTPSSSDFLTDMVFGLKWSDTYNVDLGNITNIGYNIIKSGTRQTSGSYHFQAFAANATPFNFPTSWTMNVWTEIMSISNTQNSTGTGDFEICEVGFNVTTEPNIGVNLMDYTPIINGSAMNVALPVEWLDFYILRIEDDTQLELNWITASEKNNDYFEVQKSENGINWEKIGQVTSKGESTSITNYKFIDTAPYAKNYYRLKQVDLDDKFEYSKVLIIEFESIVNITKSNIYPIPTSDILNIELQEVSENTIIQIFDIQGNKIRTVTNSPNFNKLSINVSSWNKGFYVLRIQNKNTVIIKQFEVL